MRRRRDNIYNLPVRRYEGTSDPIFFGKSTVHVGIVFQHYGRTNPNTTWVVNRIWTRTRSHGEWVQSQVAAVRTLLDLLEVRCDQTGETRILRFGYLSYSAIWRLAEAS